MTIDNENRVRNFNDSKYDIVDLNCTDYENTGDNFFDEEAEIFERHLNVSKLNTVKE